MASATHSPHGADFSITYESPQAATIVATSISREVGEIDGDRSATRIDRDGATLTIHVEAEDLVALRAGINTWLTLTTVTEQSIAAGRTFEESTADRDE
ncbi:MAG: KEOPS complex subunit Pcc1 [Halobacteriales archaeon]|nr:KEOPS complex subunit Pcc1 [Halobacteriales archaeon]